MAIDPGAAVFAKYDMTRSRFEHRWQFDIETGTSILEEGSLLVRKAGSGTTEVVAPSADAASELPLGIALHGVISAVTFTNVETVVIPSTSPYTVQLAHTGITLYGVDPQLRCEDITNGTNRVVVAGSSPGANQLGVTVATGLCTADSGLAGITATLTYSYTLTALESQLLLRESSINRGVESTYGKIIVGVGYCRVYTTMFDAGALFAVDGPGDCGVGGVFTTAARASNSVPFGRVISLPTTDDPYLGIDYVTP